MTTTQPGQRRDAAALLSKTPFLTDGGIETTLIFKQGFELPEFASFTLMASEAGRKGLRDYFTPYLSVATQHKTGFILESPTWRANPDWAAPTGYDLETLNQANLASIKLMTELREQYETEATPILISGCVGPRGDGYDPGELMSADEADKYHSWQISVFAEAGVDLVTAITMTNIPEATGFVRAARTAGLPCVPAFTVETDGTLPSGDTLADAIEHVDRETDDYPLYYMINCAHPSHFLPTLEAGDAWTNRIRGLRANASRCSHAELDEAEELDEGDPQELGREHAALVKLFPQINVLGGCCGTDDRHIAEIAKTCL